MESRLLATPIGEKSGEKSNRSFGKLLIASKASKANLKKYFNRNY
jgi:hypothetical protein